MKPTLAVSIKRSVCEKAIICLICSKMLKFHLAT